jgi:hypothetical protein
LANYKLQAAAFEDSPCFPIRVCNGSDFHDRWPSVMPEVSPSRPLLAPIVESECPQFLRTVPVLPRDPRYPDKIYDAAENHLADARRYGLRFDLTPAFSTRRRWVA